MACNNDDHVKNCSFLMDKKGTWKLAPAYDLTYAYKPDNMWLKQHQMLINGKAKNITANDLVQSGKKMNISTRRIKELIDEVTGCVARFKDYAEQAGVSEERANQIDETLKICK